MDGDYVAPDRSGTFALLLPAYCGLRACAELKSRILDALNERDVIEVVSDDVTEADVATVQLLISAQLQAAHAGKSLLLRQPVGAVLWRVFEDAGFAREGVSPNTALTSGGFQQ